MTPQTAVFWTYLLFYANLPGITALILGLIARFTARPFDTPRRFGVYVVMFGIVVLVGVTASALSFNLASGAGALASLRVSSLVAPLVAGVLIFIWASGFPLSRILPRRG
jgi:hypothetical protein